MVFREGRTKAVGTVVNVIPQTSLSQQRAKLKDKTNRTCKFERVKQGV